MWEEAKFDIDAVGVLEERQRRARAGERVGFLGDFDACLAGIRDERRHVGDVEREVVQLVALGPVLLVPPPGQLQEGVGIGVLEEGDIGAVALDGVPSFEPHPEPALVEGDAHLHVADGDGGVREAHCCQRVFRPGRQLAGQDLPVWSACSSRTISSMLRPVPAG